MNLLPTIFSLYENKKRNLDLKNKIEALGYSTLNGIGRAEDGSGQIESFLIIDIPREKAIELANEYGQVAVLFGEENTSAQLLIKETIYK